MRHEVGKRAINFIARHWSSWAPLSCYSPRWWNSLFCIQRAFDFQFFFPAPPSKEKRYKIGSKNFLHLNGKIHQSTIICAAAGAAHSRRECLAVKAEKARLAICIIFDSISQGIWSSIKIDLDCAHKSSFSCLTINGNVSKGVEWHRWHVLLQFPSVKSLVIAFCVPFTRKFFMWLFNVFACDRRSLNYSSLPHYIYLSFMGLTVRRTSLHY